MIEAKLFVTSLIVMITGLCFCFRLDWYDTKGMLKPKGEFLLECCVVMACTGFIFSLIFLGAILHEVW
jgi:hypothetical protein